MPIAFYPPMPMPVQQLPTASYQMPMQGQNQGGILGINNRGQDIAVLKLSKPPAANAKSQLGQVNQSAISTEKILNTFLDLVKIPSPSGQEEQVRQYIEARLNKLGIAKVEKLSEQQNSYIVDKTGNLIAFLPGNSASQKTLLIDTHMDVVPPCLNVKPVIRPDTSLKGDNRVVYSSGDTVLGGDDKSAIAPLLEALEVSINQKLPRPNLLLVMTAQEELGGVGAGLMDKSLFTSFPKRADLAISFDINGPQGTVVYQAPQLTRWYATVKGQSAHAGMEPEKGINALKAAMLSAVQIPVGRLDENTTANIGTLNSGNKYNIVPDKAEFTGEVRSFIPERVNLELGNIQKAFVQGTKQVPGTAFDFKYETTLKTYKTDLNQPIFTPLKQALQQSNLGLMPIQTNGGSDANVFAQYGIPSVVLSGAYQNAHRTTEFVRVQDMATLGQLMLGIFKFYQ